MSGTFTLLVLVLGAATAFSAAYPANYGGVVRVMKRSTYQSGGYPEESGGERNPLQDVILKRSTSQSRGHPEESRGPGYPLQDVTLKYLRRPAKNPSCWFQYYTKCPRRPWIKSSRISQIPVEAAPPLSTGARDSWQPIVVPAPLGSDALEPSYKVMPGWAQLNSVRLF